MADVAAKERKILVAVDEDTLILLFAKGCVQYTMLDWMAQVVGQTRVERGNLCMAEKMNIDVLLMGCHGYGLVKTYTYMNGKSGLSKLKRAYEHLLGSIWSVSS
ncbi:hypothetical protein ACFE04_007960 [Oxalis oulophora]